MDEWTLKYATGQMILGIEYLHAAKVIHRDLKPGNIFIFDDSYVKIADLGMAKQLENGLAYSMFGEYIYHAPEMSKLGGYGSAVDWWSLGLIVFQLLYNRHALKHPDGHPRGPETDENIVWNIENIPPDNVDKESRVNKFITALLMKQPKPRLGARGPEGVKNHNWFEGISFFHLIDKTVIFNQESMVPVQPDNTTDFGKILQDCQGQQPVFSFNFGEY